MKKIIIFMMFSAFLHSANFINRDENFGNSLDIKVNNINNQKTKNSQTVCNYVSDPNLYERSVIKLIKNNKLNGKIYCDNDGINMVYTTGNTNKTIQIGLVYKHVELGDNIKEINSLLTKSRADINKLLPNNIFLSDSIGMPRYYHYRIYLDFGNYKFMFLDSVLDVSTNDWTNYINKEVEATPEIYQLLLDEGYFSTTNVIY